MNRPHIGNIVHYVSYGTPGGEYRSVCRAAIVTEVDKTDAGEGTLANMNGPEEVTLCVLNPEGLFFKANRRHSEGQRTGGTWHYFDDCED